MRCNLTEDPVNWSAILHSSPQLDDASSIQWLGRWTDVLEARVVVVGFSRLTFDLGWRICSDCFCLESEELIDIGIWERVAF